ncbi:MAG: hypothetical protein J1F18_03775 [Lachnospiraceae bacterium]|nr:hypothetical protein [Lachnospiraceae bacterium]
MKNSMIGILSICFGLLGFITAYWYIGIIPCIIAIIFGIVGLMDYLAYKWSSVMGLICACLGIALFVYAVVTDIGDGNLIIACDKGDFLYVSNVDESGALDEYAEMLASARVKAAEKKVRDGEEDTDAVPAADNEQGRSSSAENTVVVDRTVDSGETASSDSYVKGINYGTYWESEWLGMRYDQPSGFTLTSGAELDFYNQFAGAMASVISEAADVSVEGGDVLSMLQNTVYELMVSSDSEDVGLVIGVERSDKSASGYAEWLRQQMKDSYADPIIQELEFEGTEEIGGRYFEKYTAVTGQDGYNTDLICYIMKKDDRVVYIELTYPEGASSDADAIMSGFSEL